MAEASERGRGQKGETIYSNGMAIFIYLLFLSLSVLSELIAHEPVNYI